MIMARLHRTREESVAALHRALSKIWHLVHHAQLDLNKIKLSDISREFRISTLPVALVKPYVLCERQPTYASAAKLREILSINARSKGGTRNHTNSPTHTAQPPRNQATLFNFNNYEAVEDINRLQDILNAAGYNVCGLEVTLRDNSYTLKLEITKQTK